MNGNLFFLSLLFLLLPRPGLSQQTIYFGVFGEGTAFSLNYETTFFEIGSFSMTGKLGLGIPNIGTSILKTSKTLNSGFSLPHYITGNIGRKHHQFEAGFGGVIIHTKDQSCYQFLPIIGYRLRPLDTGLLFRFFVHPKNPDKDTCSIISPIGISFGYLF